MIQKLTQFLQKDIWRISLRRKKGWRPWLIQNVRIILVAIRGFHEDKCQLRASALTFYTLLSIVPVAAMAFGIAKGFGFEKMLHDQLIDKLQGQEEIAQRIIEFSQTMLENTKGGLIAGIGVALLFWTVIKVLETIELSFNDIWGIKTARSLSRKFSDYLSIMFICPILFIISSSMTVYITSQITTITQKISVLGTISPFIFFMLNLLPYAVLWFMFSFVYIVIPNTSVRFIPGLFGGIIAGTLYHVMQWAYITFQIGISKYGAIYGSFAALPFFLTWLQASWLIVLFGAELSFAHQNVETYEFEPDCLAVSPSLKKLLSLYILQTIIRSFVRGEKPLSDIELSHALELPIRLVRDLLFDLTQAALVIEVMSENRKLKSYHPRKDIHQLTILSACQALDTRGTDDLPLEWTPPLQKLKESLDAIAATIQKSPGNMVLGNLIT